MAVLGSERDLQALTLVITAELKASPEDVWQMWGDLHKLERWWGPPGWPATFLVHEFSPGGRSYYFMTGPSGEKYGGWMRTLAVEEFKMFEFDDGFADDAGLPDDTMPTTHGRVELQGQGKTTRMTLTSRWDSQDDMQKLLEMGMEEGMKLAMGQMDALLAPGEPPRIGM